MLRVAALIAAILTLQACVSVRSYHGYALERGQDELIGEAGLDTKESVLAKFGEPSLIGTFDRNAWYYLNSADETRAFFKPTTKARTVVAFYFDPEGVLKEMGEFDLADGGDINSSPARRRPAVANSISGSSCWVMLVACLPVLAATAKSRGQ